MGVKNEFDDSERGDLLQDGMVVEKVTNTYIDNLIGDLHASFVEFENNLERTIQLLKKLKKS